MENRRRKILIFAGAGASFALNKNKYPTTAEFIERFPENLAEEQFFQYIKKNLTRKFGDGTPDVEKVLWCIEELIEYFQKANDPKSPVNWFLPNNLLPSLTGVSGDVASYARMASNAVGRLVNIRDRINAHLYEVYGDNPSKNEVSENWGALLPKLIDAGWWIDLVTTNYDLVIESVVDLYDLNVGYGRTRGAVSKLDTDKWRNALVKEDRPYKDGLITKLHGSLNWERDKRNGIVLGGVEFKTDHRHHVAIYPGFKGVPKGEPFGLFHDYFERSLQNAECVVFIGFAFRDEYINTLLIRSPQKKYFVIDPSDLTEVPGGLRERISHIKLGFGKNSVDALLKELDV